jgi:CRISPR/Cas system CMR-associated protein Cmr1 (group 7 of RAMP superfamily)
MRTPPSSPAPLRFKPHWLRSAGVKLITRLFGGGAKVREIDDISWLRSSAAKSAIRSWWRAGHVHDFSTLEELRAREAELFGSASTYDASGARHGGPGALQVIVQTWIDRSTLEEYEETAGNPLNVALFPASVGGNAKVARVSDQNIAKILLNCGADDSSIHDALLSALRLWLTLGGVGSRTRRGAGAIALRSSTEAQSLGVPGSLDELKTFLQNHCTCQDLPGFLTGFFSLARTRKVFVGPTWTSTGEEAQKKLLIVLKQARSNWHTKDRYTKAALGLPIQIKFKSGATEHILAAVPDEKEETGWRKLERYSSPILLRPVQVWEDGKPKFVPVAIFTDCTLPPTARPAVLADPKARVKDSDVVQSFEILKESESILKGVADVFESTPEFSSL